MRRIIGSCNKADLKDVMHLTGWIEEGREIDRENLTKRQNLAVKVIYVLINRGTPLTVLDNVKEVLLWELDDGKQMIEYKLIDPRKLETREILRRSI